MSCGRWTMGRLGCREEVGLSEDVVVESEAKVRPTLLIASPPHLKCLYACKTTLSRKLILSPLPSLHCQTHELTRPHVIAVWHISDIFPFMLAVRVSYRFERREGRSTFRTSGIRLQTTGFSHIVRAFIVDQIPGEKNLWIRTCTRRQHLSTS